MYISHFFVSYNSKSEKIVSKENIEVIQIIYILDNKSIDILHVLLFI